MKITEFIIHKGLYESGRWFKMSIFEQMGNIGSDVDRAINWRNKGDLEMSKQAFYRALELFDFTIADKKHRGTGRLREILRARECLVDYFMGDNEYRSTDETMKDYFYRFAYASAMERGR